VSWNVLLPPGSVGTQTSFLQGTCLPGTAGQPGGACVRRGNSSR